MITRAYVALYLGGTPSQETGTTPPSCLLLKNHLCIQADKRERYKCGTVNNISLKGMSSGRMRRLMQFKVFSIILQIVEMKGPQ